MEFSATEVDELDSLVVDLSGSSDSDGQIVKVEIDVFSEAARVSFEPQRLVADNIGEFTFVAQNVWSDDTLLFQVRITDDRGDSDTGTVEVQLRNTPSSPKAAGIEEIRTYNVGRPLRLLGEITLGSGDLLAVDLREEVAGAGVRPLVLGDPFVAVDDYSIVREMDVKDTVPSVDKAFIRELRFDLLPGSADEFMIASEKADELSWFVDFDSTGNHEYDKEIVTPIEAPCEMVGKHDSGQDIIWVGQRSVGLSVLRFMPNRPDGYHHEGFTTAVISKAGEGRSLCHIFPTRLAAPPGIFPLSGFSDLITIDFDRNEIVTFVDRVAPAEEYELHEVIPIDIDETLGLQIMDVQSAGLPGEVPRLVWILMTDGQSGGEHRVVIIREGENDELIQDVVAWSGDVPTSMNIANIFGPEALIDFSYDLVITSAAGSAIVFEDEQNLVNEFLNQGPRYKPATYFDIDPGADSAIVVAARHVNDGAAPNAALLVSYPDAGLLKLYRDLD